MPELPDVAGFKSYIDATALHQPIARTSIKDDRILKGVSRQSLSARLKGKAIGGIRRHGKFLFAMLEDDASAALVMHFGMTGQPAYFEGDDLPEYTTVVLEFKGGGRLAYICKRMLGRISWADDVDAFIEAEDLGPDALDEQLDWSRFSDLLADRRGAIKSTLMSQSTVAGVGNVYADEICFQARVDPATPVKKMPDKMLKRVYRQMRRVLRMAADRGGKIADYPRTWLLSARERGQDTCPRCDAKLKTKKLSGRTTHFCPDCQEKL